MKYERLIPEFGRLVAESDSRFDYALISLPDGTEEKCEAYRYQPVEFQYDDHGYETVVPVSGETMRFAYTPRFAGKYAFTAYRGNEVIGTGEFECAPSDHPGYTVVSPEDPRYFAYSRGGSYVPVGINLVGPSGFQASSGEEFGKTNRMEYMGLAQYENWFRKCEKNGVNFVRLWLSNAYFNPSREQAYDLDYAKFSIIDRIVDMAREHGIRLKLTFEHFRIFDAKDGSRYGGTVFLKQFAVGDRKCGSMTEFLTDPLWREAWEFKMKEMTKRYAGDPVIFAFEPWNEMNCVDAEFDLVNEWNQVMLPRLKALAPYNLVTNSFGSLDSTRQQQNYNTFCWDKCDFKQVHRYLDQGAPFAVCHGDPVDFMRDAVTTQKLPDEPIVIAETGAVNDCHSGPFRFYGSDVRGLIFADTVFAPFFAGAASCGHIWHWGQYVEPNDLFRMFAPFARLVADYEPAAEKPEAVDLSDSAMHAVLLKGERTGLLYLRSRADSWAPVLRDLREPAPLADFEIPLPVEWKAAELIPIWQDDPVAIEISGNALRVSGLTHGAFVKITG